MEHETVAEILDYETLVEMYFEAHPDATRDRACDFADVMIKIED